MADSHIIGIRYGVTVLRPEQLVQFVSVEERPKTLADRALSVAKKVGGAALVLAGVCAAVVAGAFGLYVIGASQLSGLYGLVVGMLGFLVWSGGRG